ncbi:MAG: glycoside-pentoside-hexuronide (GPH):cation symporter [Peptococcaceae bacterium]|jgi:sugar (glycoside-pentoside-hexuronide) transporter|nr:glycoside-pentoside-hexuronide (GPH):cation symporter [Peptococcaceae bacterium]
MAEDRVQSSLADANVALTNKERFCYACGVIGMIIPFNLPLGYLTFYWTDVAMIPASLVGTFLMVNKLWDAINDPIIGSMADRTNTPKGRYRPWMIPTGIISNLTCLLLFIRIPGASTTLQYVCYFGSYFIFVAAFTALEIPHISMQSTMTTDYQQRGILTAWRQTSASLVMTIIAATYLPMTVYLVPGDRSAGYFYATLIFLIISTPFYFICYFGTRERVIPPPPAEDTEKPTLIDSLKCLKGNTPTLMLMGAHLMHGLNGISGSARMYFWSYVAGDPLYAAVNGTFTSGGGIFAAIFVGGIVRKYPHKQRIAIGGWSVSALIAFILYFVPVDNATGRLIFNVLSTFRGIAGSMGFVSLFSMVPECTEYTIAKYGLRASGFIFAVVNFMFKFGTSFNQGLFGWIMGAMHYVPNVAQPPALLFLFRFCVTAAGGILQLIGVLFFRGYKITKETHDAMLQELSKA